MSKESNQKIREKRKSAGFQTYHVHLRGGKLIKLMLDKEVRRLNKITEGMIG